MDRDCLRHHHGAEWRYRDKHDHEVADAAPWITSSSVFESSQQPACAIRVESFVVLAIEIPRQEILVRLVLIITVQSSASRKSTESWIQHGGLLSARRPPHPPSNFRPRSPAGCTGQLVISSSNPASSTGKENLLFSRREQDDSTPPTRRDTLIRHTTSASNSCEPWFAPV